MIFPGDNNGNNNFTNVRYNIHYVDGNNLDPHLLEFLPPELRNAIVKDLNSSTSANSEQEETPRPKIKFDYKMVNCNQDLKVLTTKLKKSKIKQYGLLLYGVSGSGKSFYGQWLAQELKMPFIKKRASDLEAKFVGETEQNIKMAFKEARDKKAILLFDEADSFLFDRRYAKQNHQASSVNEILTQMEDHPYPFIMTTNLKDKIDNASLRRFIFKIKYDYMKPENIVAGVKTYFGKEYKLTQNQIAKLTHICSGDFKVAKAKIDILDDGQYSNDLIFEYLLKEQEEKEIDTGSNAIMF